MPEGQRLLAALGAAADIAYEWDVQSGSLEFLSDPTGLGSQFAAIRNAEALAARIHPDDATTRSAALARHLAGSGGEPFECEFRVRDDHDDPVWVHDRGIAVYGPGGQPVRITGVLRMIGARKAREAQLEYLANHDELTGHYNRGRLREALEHALGAARRYGIAGAYLVVGIDRLAPIGDAFGIESADAIVIAIGRVLDRSLRNIDIIGRIGPDRFGVVLSHSPVVDLAITAEKILAAVRLARIEAQGSELHVTVSIGGVAFQENAPAVADIMGRGETALQAAEQQGRDCFALYQDGPTHREQRRHAMWVVEEVQSGLKDGRVMLSYQPIVDSVTRRPDHYECLIRLRRRNGQVVTAANFVPLVEQSGLVRQVDRRAVELAIEELSAYPDLRLAVNVSGHTTSDRNWLRTLATLVRGIPEVAQRLTVEITETVALQDIDETARFVRKLRDLGCRVSLDDFGAGYTSFRNLKALEVDCVKIDGSFVRGLSENIDNQLFVRTLIGLADGLGLFTVAECVENEEDSALLARRGVRFMQGWHFGKPSLERPWLPESGAATSSPAASAAPKLTVVNGGRSAFRGV